MLGLSTIALTPLLRLYQRNNIGRTTQILSSPLHWEIPTLKLCEGSQFTISVKIIGTNTNTIA